MELKRIKQLIDLMKKNEVCELEIEEPDFRVKIKTGVSSNIMPGMAQLLPPYSASLPAPDEKKTAAASEPAEKKNLMTVKSPMVGTFYRSPGPDKPSYIEEGDVVKQGQILCIIEAMKLMNEIESPYDGKLVSVLVKNAQPVEYDEPLFLIEVA
jgi:acetyl-CoA carboxylase biotin carboxyl carrier protein